MSKSAITEQKIRNLMRDPAIPQEQKIKVLRRNQGRLLPVVEGVEISPDVMIDCPATLPRVRYAAKCCPDCEHFDGIARKGWSDDPDEQIPWDVEFCIRCRYPMERVTKIILIHKEHIEK